MTSSISALRFSYSLWTRCHRAIASNGVQHIKIHFLFWLQKTFFDTRFSYCCQLHISNRSYLLTHSNLLHYKLWLNLYINVRCHKNAYMLFLYVTKQLFVQIGRLRSAVNVHVYTGVWHQTSQHEFNHDLRSKTILEIYSVVYTGPWLPVLQHDV